MANKSRFQLINRGRKGKPCWVVEDFQGFEGKSVGKYIFSDRLRCVAESWLLQCRVAERATKN